jgi:hypothetical protein
MRSIFKMSGGLWQSTIVFRISHYAASVEYTPRRLWNIFREEIPAVGCAGLVLVVKRTRPEISLDHFLWKSDSELSPFRFSVPCTELVAAGVELSSPEPP